MEKLLENPVQNINELNSIIPTLIDYYTEQPKEVLKQISSILDAFDEHKIQIDVHNSADQTKVVKFAS